MKAPTVCGLVMASFRDLFICDFLKKTTKENGSFRFNILFLALVIHMTLLKKLQLHV
jgi:hypothetical protein